MRYGAYLLPSPLFLYIPNLSPFKVEFLIKVDSSRDGSFVEFRSGFHYSMIEIYYNHACLMQGQHMHWHPHRNYLQTALNCHEINVNFNMVVALLFVSIMMLNQHTVGPSTLFPAMYFIGK